MTITDQDIVEAYYTSGNNKAEAARSLGMAPSTYKDRLGRAMDAETAEHAAIAQEAAGHQIAAHAGPSNAHLKVSERILIIGDTHLGPGTSHQDYLSFCCSVHDKYDLETVLHVGDVADWSSVSYHEKEFWSVSPDQERDAVTKAVKPWAEAFPEMHITVGNHCDLPRRKLKTFGLPLAMMGPDRNYLIGGPDGWTWSQTASFRLACGIPCVMAHSFSSSWTAFAKMADTCSLIQGHHHDMGGVAWSNNPHGKTFALSVGCGINPNHRVFNYRRNGRSQLTEPMLGCGAIVDGQALFLPMWTDEDGRWIGKVP